MYSFFEVISKEVLRAHRQSRFAGARRGLEKTVGPFTKRHRNAPRGQERVRTGLRSLGNVGKCLDGPLYCFEGSSSSYTRHFSLLGKVMSYRAAHLNKVALLTTTQHSTPTNRRKSSATARPREAKWRFYGSPRLRQSNSRARRRRPSRSIHRELEWPVSKAACLYTNLYMVLIHLYKIKEGTRGSVSGVEKTPWSLFW